MPPLPCSLHLRRYGALERLLLALSFTRSLPSGHSENWYALGFLGLVVVYNSSITGVPPLRLAIHIKSMTRHKDRIVSHRTVSFSDLSSISFRMPGYRAVLLNTNSEPVDLSVTQARGRIKISRALVTIYPYNHRRHRHRRLYFLAKFTM
jgi:hypothetical protein